MDFLLPESAHNVGTSLFRKEGYSKFCLLTLILKKVFLEGPRILDVQTKAWMETRDFNPIMAIPRATEEDILLSWLLCQLRHAKSRRQELEYNMTAKPPHTERKDYSLL